MEETTFQDSRPGEDRYYYISVNVKSTLCSCCTMFRNLEKWYVNDNFPLTFVVMLQLTPEYVWERLYPFHPRYLSRYFMFSVKDGQKHF
jgi:hypothetical protein